MDNKFFVHALFKLHLVLPVTVDSKEEALKYFMNILSQDIIDLIEMDIHTTKDKVHIAYITDNIKVEVMDVQKDGDI